MTPWLAALTKVERLAYSSIYGGLRRGLSGAATLRSFRGGGGAIRTQTFYGLWRQIADLYARGGRVRYISREATPRAESLPEIGVRQLREYSFLVKVGGITPRAEGDPGYFVTVSTSRLMPRAQIEATVQRMMRTQYQDAQAGAYTYQLFHGQRAAVFGA